MNRHTEIPSDTEVCRVLSALGTVTARELVDELKKPANGEHSRRDAQRAVQRCLDRGKISLGAGLRLSVANSATPARIAA